MYTEKESGTNNYLAANITLCNVNNVLIVSGVVTVLCDTQQRNCLLNLVQYNLFNTVSFCIQYSERKCRLLAGILANI